MNLVIFSCFLITLCICFAPTQQQGRRAPSAAPAVQSTQANAGNRRAQQPQQSFSRGGPQSQSQPTSDDNSGDSDEESGEEKAFVCPKADGLFSDPNSCRKFRLCGSWKSWSQSCPPSLYFDGKLKFCTFKSPSLTCGPVSEEETRKEEQERNQDKLPACDPAQCQLPNCFCSEEGSTIPGNIPPNQTPQMVLINFSGALNELVYDYYRKILGYNNKLSAHQTRHNPNGCGIRATFFINHEYSNYAQIQWLAAQGHEIALHSITHRLPEIWWTDTANYSDWAEEIIGMREIILSNSAGSSSSNPAVTREGLVGMRSPYMKPGGDPMFEMAHDFGLLYDSSVVAPRGGQPYWPFTWDYRQPFECSNNKKSPTEEKKSADGDDIISSNRQNRPGGSGRQKRQIKKVKPQKKTFQEKKITEKLNKRHRVRRNSPFLGRPLKCPTKAYPGLWEIPINPLWDEYNTCHHADQCVFPNSSDDEDIDDITEFLKENFERHYSTNRAPFQLNFHVTWFTQKGHVKALNKFFDYLLTLNDVWFVTYQQMISWMKDPKPIPDANSYFKCDNSSIPATCNRPHTCVLRHYLDKDNRAATEDNFHKSDTRYMPVCHSSVCPQQYQWFGNHAGRKDHFKSIMQLVDDAVGPEQPEQTN